MESPASLFAIYSYFLETLKASHLIASNNSHLSVVNTKAISFLEWTPLEMDLCLCDVAVQKYKVSFSGYCRPPS